MNRPRRGQLIGKLAGALVATCLLLTTGEFSRACQVPVFRYALEHWQPDVLPVMVVHDGPLDAEQQQLIQRIEAAADDAGQPVNLRLTLVDKAEQHAENSLEAFVIQQWGQSEQPQLLLFFGSPAPRPELAWSTDFNATSVDQLLASPARAEIARRLLDGQSAVWVLLQTGNEQADQAAEATLREELARQAETIQLPSLTDLATEQQFDPTLGVELRVDFSLITIAPDDPAEACFRSMLLSTEPDLREFPEPIAIPIYGRGRTYFALVGPGITPGNIMDNCTFICGACSCEVKVQNPGKDLLLAANWQQIEPGNWGNNTPLPALTGIGQFEALVAEEAASEQRNVAATAESSSPDEQLLASTAPVNQQGSKVDAGTVAEKRPNQPLETEVEAEIAGTTSAADAKTSTSRIAIGLLFGWIGVLLCVGLGVTVWRNQHAD